MELVLNLQIFLDLPCAGNQMITSPPISIPLTSSTVMSKREVPVNPEANTSCFMLPRTSLSLLDQDIQRERRTFSKVMMRLVTDNVG